MRNLLAVATMAIALWAPFSTQAAIVLLNQTLDVTSADHSNPLVWEFQGSDFEPFSSTIGEGDYLIWRIDFLSGQSVTVPTMSFLFAQLFSSAHPDGNTRTGTSLEAQTLRLFDSSGAEIGWVPGDGNLSTGISGSFDPKIYNAFWPEVTFSSLEVRLRLTDLVTPGLTSETFDSARLAFGTFLLFPGQTFTPTRTVPNDNKLFHIQDPPIVVTPPPTSAVPEPSVWAMMIAGFGLVGAALRRRRAGEFAKAA
jgi:hypothetical protein